MVVEVDGDTHIGREEYDASRDYYMSGLGIEVVRVSDFKVQFDEDSVVAQVEIAIEKRAREIAGSNRPS